MLEVFDRTPEGATYLWGWIPEPRSNRDARLCKRQIGRSAHDIPRVGRHPFAHATTGHIIWYVPPRDIEIKRIGRRVYLHK